MPSRSSRRTVGIATLGERHTEPRGPPPDDPEGPARSAGDRHVTALDDRCLLPGDRLHGVTEPGLMVKGHVRDWPTPRPRHGSRRGAPASPTSTRATATPSSANHRNSIAVSSSNSVGCPWRRSIRSAASRVSPTSPANVTGSIGRRRSPAAPGRTQVRLGRRPGHGRRGAQCAPGQREDAALAVGPPDRAPRTASCGSPRTCRRLVSAPAPAEPEPPALLQRSNRRVVRPRGGRVVGRRPQRALSSPRRTRTG